MADPLPDVGLGIVLLAMGSKVLAPTGEGAAPDTALASNATRRPTPAADVLTLTRQLIASLIKIKGPPAGPRMPELLPQLLKEP